jgi:hypothetical protein
MFGMQQQVIDNVKSTLINKKKKSIEHTIQYNNFGVAK